MEMNATPAHIRQARGCPGTNSIYRDEFVNVQRLYRDCKYKQCATLCEDLLGLKLHPLHEGFLWYYHATCYECMGLAAHKFSRNKLHFLDLARDGLDTTLRVLPSAYATSARGCYEEHEASPLASTIPTKAAPYRYNIFSQPESPCTWPSTDVTSTCPDSIYSVKTCTSEAPSDPDAKESSSPNHTCMALLTPTKQEHAPSSTPPVILGSSHKDRLLKSLSTMHTLAEGLVPSPLFSRSRKITAGTAEDVNGGCDSSSRPLPPLPFNHTMKFQIQGNRIVQIPDSTTPVRKTAVQTLISIFEGTLPLSLSPSLSDSAWSPSPLTPRFTQIKEAFSPDPANDHLEAYLDSTDLSHYNASLAEFRHQLRKQISFVNEQIHLVQAAQAEHSRSKVLTQNRLASFWSFEQAPAPSSDFPARSADGRVIEDARAVAKKARIEKLRLNGWAVSKERHGFKGEQYYENLRRVAERELNICNGLHAQIASLNVHRPSN